MSDKLPERQLRRLFPEAPESFIKANAIPENNGVRPTEQKQPEGNALERPAQRKVSSSARYAISFKIYSQRPIDWDNYWTKCIQDILVKTGIIHDDAWNVLHGSIKSEKAYSKEEERTEIIIEELSCN